MSQNATLQKTTRIASSRSITGSDRLHVVMIDEELPYPPTSGKRIRSLNLTLRLARRHNLTYLCHRNADPGETRDAVAFFARLAANLLSPLPYSVASHNSARLRAALRQHATLFPVDLWHCEWAPYAE